MLIGIVFSSGTSRVVSLNNTGMLISKQLSEEFNRENLLLFLHEPRSMAGYEIEYTGEQVEPRKKSGFVNRRDIIPTEDPFTVVAKRDIMFDGEKLYNAGDRFEIYPENTYYEIEFRKNGKVQFVQRPRVQINAQMGNVASPDISRSLEMDLYTHVSAPMTDEAKEDWGEPQELSVKREEQFFLNDYVANINDVTRVFEVGDIKLDSTFVAVKVNVKVQGERGEYTAEPIIIYGSGLRGGLISDEIDDLGLKITVTNIDPVKDEIALRVNSRQKNWVVIKALEKPMINVLWIGTLLLMAGFIIAMTRRLREFNLMKVKGLEQ
jgi:cytochrome c-type biogenesis protein CcmF